MNEAGVPGVSSATLAHLGSIFRASSLALVVEDDGGVLGVCLVLGPGADYLSVNDRWLSERYGDFAYLARVAVAPTARGQGVGSLFYDEVERRTQASWFLLEVNLRPRNDGALRFHERKGIVGRLGSRKRTTAFSSA